MKEIVSIIKKYSLGIFFVVIFLVIQARCDLKLPEYTSNIINVGITQKGIQDNVPEALSKNSFDVLSVLVGNELSYFYERVPEEKSEIIEKYPYAKEEDIYLLKEMDEKKRKELSELIKKAEVFSLMLSTNQQFAEKGYKVDATILKYYMGLEEENEIKTMLESINSIDEQILNQYSIQYVVMEYNTLKIDIEKKQLDYLISTGVKMLVFALFIMLVIIITTYISGKIAASVAYDLREKVVEKVMQYSNSEFNEFSTSSLITRSTNDISQIQMLLTMLLRMVLYAPIIGVGALIKVIDIDMIWVIGIAIGAIMLLIIILLLFAMPKFKVVQKLIDRINLVVRETLNGLPVIRAFANEDFEQKKFKKANIDLMKVNLFTQRLMALMNPFMMFIMNGICVLIMWVGANHVDAGTMQVGTLTALISYTMQIIMAFLMLSMISIMAPRAMISINRVGEILKKDSSIKNAKNAKHIEENDDFALEFDHVSFQYPDGDELVLKDINFKVPAGSTLAIIGSTGSGKSSIINLIPRFFDVTEGMIKLNGVDIREFDLTDLRNTMGIVPQKGLLFSGTIASNIKFSDESMSDDVMKEAARVACAEDFILKKEGQYDAPISQGGTNVSGGQRQRLAIARAVASNPKIYLFDDSFSALDYKTDASVRKNLADYCKDATKIIVAQRVGTVMNADQIVVLEKGCVVGIGTHKELYENCKIYKEIALSQLKEEELV